MTGRRQTLALRSSSASTVRGLVYHFGETATNLIIQDFFYAVSVRAFITHQRVKLTFQQIPFIGFRHGCLHLTASAVPLGPLSAIALSAGWPEIRRPETTQIVALLPAFRAAGAQLVAISPQNAANSRKSIRNNGLDFPILSDPCNETAAAFGLRFALPDYLVDLYKSLKNDLPAFNGDASWTLPMPGPFLVGQDGVIRYAEVNPDYTRRPEPADMLAVLRTQAARVA